MRYMRSSPNDPVCLKSGQEGCGTCQAAGRDPSSETSKFESSCIERKLKASAAEAAAEAEQKDVGA